MLTKIYMRDANGIALNANGNDLLLSIIYKG